MSQPVSDSSLAAGSIAVALIGLGLKLLAFGLTGSVALFSDAMESLVNVAGAVMAWGAIRYAARPADADHPFGHHKSENVSHHQIIFSPNHFKWKTDYNFPPLVFMFSFSFRVLIDLNVLRSEWLVVRSVTDVKTGGSLSSN